jgi:hypothetical protein
MHSCRIIFGRRIVIAKRDMVNLTHRPCGDVLTSPVQAVTAEIGPRKPIFRKEKN